MIHDRNTGPMVMTKTEKVKTFFEPYTRDGCERDRARGMGCSHPSPTTPANETLERKKTYLIKALREKYVVACAVCVRV